MMLIVNRKVSLLKNFRGVLLESTVPLSRKKPLGNSSFQFEKDDQTQS